MRCKQCTGVLYSDDGLSCKSCGTGKSINLHGTACVKCKAGTYWLSGLCADCPNKKFSAKDAATSCETCPMNSVSNENRTGYVLRVFPLCAPVPRVQGSSGAVATVQFAWRAHTKSLTTRARSSPDLAVWLE